MIKLITLLEEKMTPAQKKKRGKIFDKLKASGMSDAKAGAIATSKAMSENLNQQDKYSKYSNDALSDMIVNLLRYENTKDLIEPIKKELERRKKNTSEKLDPVGQEDADIDNDGDTDKTDKYLINRRKAIAANLKEGDHEVAMAVSSLEAIAEAIVELRQQLGNTERNIPGWIQDHIAKAENYIEQAAQGFHELKGDE
jgi:pyruvate/2-oxoglutarate dehydrogenase complex dihydrolipoamide acyltransferase (E2) component